MTTNIKNEVSLTNLEAIYLIDFLNKTPDDVIDCAESVKFTSINNESTVKIKTIKGLTTELNLTAGVSAFLNKENNND